MGKPGIVDIRPARRTEQVQEYYFSRKLKQIDEMRRSGLDVINLGIGSPDQPPSAEVIETLHQNALNSRNHGYQSYIGIPALRAAFAEWYAKYFKVTLDPNSEILPLIGSKEGIMHISMAFVNENDEVLIPNPGYPAYESATRLVGGRIRYYDLKEDNNWYPDLDALGKEDLEKVKLMWVNYPHMPTGTPATPELFKNLADFARTHNILLVNDNPYSFILNTDRHSLLATEGAKEVALELNSLSKSHNMAGWRIGMVAGKAEFIKTIMQVKSNMDSGMFQPLQAAATQALKAGDDWYASVNRVYTGRRKKAETIMTLLDCSFDPRQTGLFLWGKIPDIYENVEQLTEKVLHEALVFITPGFIFGSNGARYIRISLCSAEERLEESALRIRKIIKR